MCECVCVWVFVCVCVCEVGQRRSWQSDTSDDSNRNPPLTLASFLRPAANMYRGWKTSGSHTPRHDHWLVHTRVHTCTAKTKTRMTFMAVACIQLCGHNSPEVNVHSCNPEQRKSDIHRHPNAISYLCFVQDKRAAFLLSPYPVLNHHIYIMHLVKLFF